jgi:hypothetical protein
MRKKIANKHSAVKDILKLVFKIVVKNTIPNSQDTYKISDDKENA